jgi:hypothetical protein
MHAAVARLAEIPGARHISFVLKFGVSIGLIVLVFRQIDAKALVECLATQSTIWIAATVLVSLLQIALLTLRWQQILRALGSQSGLGSALAVTFMGCFFGAFLFGPTGSDVARAVLAPTRSLGRRSIVHSVLFERLASVIGLGLAAAPLVALDALPLSYRMPLIAALVIVVVIFVVIIGITQLAHGFLQRGRGLVPCPVATSRRAVCRFRDPDADGHAAGRAANLGRRLGRTRGRDRRGPGACRGGDRAGPGAVGRTRADLDPGGPARWGHLASPLVLHTAPARYWRARRGITLAA